MPTYVYVALQDDDKISVFTIDAGTGKLLPKAEVPVSDAPSLMAISPDREFLYVGHRDPTGISSWRIDQGTGGLTRIGRVSTDGWSAFLGTDRKGKYLLSAYYQAGHVGVHPIGDDGAVGEPPIEWLATDIGAHAIQTDPSNKFAFVPHIARLFDNVMEPVKDAPGPNVIFQFKFDENTGRLTPNSPLKVEAGEGLGPRYFCFHPTLGRCLLFRRAGLQCNQLSFGHFDGSPDGFSNYNDTARRLHRKEHVLPDSNLLFGEIPVCSQPRPQQHRGLLSRRLQRAVDGHWPSVNRSCTQRLQPGP